jgi:hypothetical protein
MHHIPRVVFNVGLSSFVKEAQLLARFDHPCLVKVYRFWEANGTGYMVMPYYQAPTLKQVLKEEHSPLANEVWLKDFLGHILNALQVLHDKQCYHRDIAPDNILMLDQEIPLLLDFGAARRVIGDMTQALTVILKPGYAPIEQYGEMGDMAQGPWTDLYALASVIYFIIAGKVPQAALSRLVDDKLVPLAESARGRYSHAFLQAVDAAERAARAPSAECRGIPRHVAAGGHASHPRVPVQHGVGRRRAHASDDARRQRAHFTGYGRTAHRHRGPPRRARKRRDPGQTAPLAGRTARTSAGRRRRGTGCHQRRAAVAGQDHARARATAGCRHGLRAGAAASCIGPTASGFAR